MINIKELLSKTDLVIGYTAILVMAWVYLTHAIPAISSSPGFVALVTGIGIPVGIAKMMVSFVGVIDLLIAVSLFLYRKKWVVIYAGLWPIVPFFLVYLTMDVWIWMELFYGPVLGIVAYLSFFGLPTRAKKTGDA